MPQFICEEDLSCIDNFIFSKKESNHLKVFRVKLGDKIKVLDKKCDQYMAVIEKFENGFVYAKKIEKIEKEKPVITLKAYIPFIEKGEFEYAIKKATEIGCDFFSPLITQYVQKNHIFDLKEKMTRLNEIILSAVKQSERNTMAKILNPKNIMEIDFSKEKIIALSIVDYKGNKSSKISEILNRFTNEISILIGPEGGFSKSEMEFMKDKVFYASLGENILRTETALIAACSIIKALK